MDEGDEEEAAVNFIVDTKGMLGNLLKTSTKMTDLDRDGVSKASSDDALSTGASTNVSGGAGGMARNHKAGKMENFQLKQKVLQKEAEMEKMRAAYEKMRMDLEKARIGNVDVTMAGNEEEATGAKTEVEEGTDGGKDRVGKKRKRRRKKEQKKTWKKSRTRNGGMGPKRKGLRVIIGLKNRKKRGKKEQRKTWR